MKKFYFWKCHTPIAQQTASQVANVVETASVGRVLESGKWSMHGRRGVPFEDVPPHPRNRSFFCLEQLNAMAAKSLEHCRVERDEKGSTLNSIDECESDKNSTEAKS